MTLLASLSRSLAVADRTVSGLRRLADGRPPMYMTVPANQPIQLQGDPPRLITYADSVATDPAVWAVWCKLVRNLATVDVGVFREDPQTGDLTRVHGTGLERLLRRPAPGKGLTDLLQWFFNPYYVEGNSLLAPYWPRDEFDEPQALLPLDWRFMSALARPGGPVELWVSHQIGEPRELLPEQVIHFAWESPNGCAIGTSALRSLGTAVNLRDAERRYSISSLANGARPEGFLTLPEDSDMTPEEQQELVDRANERHRGVDQAFMIALLSGGVTWQRTGLTAVEAELDSMRRRTEREVCMAWDVRLSAIADPEAGGRGAVQETLRDFHRSLFPHARRFEDVILRQLIDRVPKWEGLVVKLDLSELRRGTYREEAETAAHLYTNGLTGLKESRRPLGLGEVDPEDEPRVPHAQLDPADGRRQAPSDETDPSRETRPAGPAGT